MHGFSDSNSLLACHTPEKWIETALRNQDILLIDHANCEKKAAATAMSLMFRYGERHLELQETLSRLARDELGHFEQVMRLMKKRDIRYRPLSAARYAGDLRKHLHKHEPERLVDLLVIGAFIEARSCERFRALAPHLDAELADFYVGLAAAESRHFADYLRLARCAGTGELAARIHVFAKVEADLISGADNDFRFHSGVVF